MTVNIKVKEIMDKGKWLELCDMFGINEWAVNEGLIDSEEEFVMTTEQAKELGLLK